MADYPATTYQARSVAELQALNLGGGNPTHAEYDVEVGDEIEAVEADLRAAIADGGAATTIQQRLQEIDTVVGAADTLIGGHIADATAAHAASAISYQGGTGISATDVEGAIDELATEKGSAADLTAHIDDPTDAHDASAVSFTTYLTVTGPVQDAIEQIEDARLDNPYEDLDWWRANSTYWDDFTSVDSAPPGWTATTIGTGSAAAPGTNVSAQIPNHPGIYIITGGSTTSGVSILSRGTAASNNCQLSATTPHDLLWIVRTGSAASDGTNTYEYDVGLHDALTNVEPVNFMGFQYNIGNFAGNGHWAAITRNNNVETNSVNDTGVPWAASTWFALKYSFDGTTVTYYIDGAQVATETSNIPTATVGLAAMVRRFTAATQTRALQLDFVGIILHPTR